MTQVEGANELLPAAESRATRYAWVAALIAAFVFALIYPGQTPFINDEASLIHLASDLNVQRKIARVGYQGTQGHRYGPLVPWIFQAFLVVTRNPIAVMTMYIALQAGMLLGALGWLQRSTGWWRWGLFAVALSPYVWFYERMLWDNTFNIPLGLMWLAAYASYLKRPRGWVLLLAIFLAGLMLLVHLMAVAPVAAFGVHLLVVRRRDLQSFWRFALAGAIAVLATGWSYWPYLFHSDLAKINRSDAPNGWWFALCGPRVLSGAWIDYLFADDWVEAGGRIFSLFGLCRDIASLIAFPLTWAGLAMGAFVLVRRWRRSPTPASELAAFCAMIVMAQIVLNGTTHTYGHPHYYSATFCAFAVAMWFAMDQLVRLPFASLVGWTQIAVVACMPVLLLVRVLQTGGTRDLQFGPTLANKVEVVRRYGEYAEGSHVDIEVNILEHSISAIVKLQPPHRTGAEPKRDLVLRYASQDLYNARIELVERAASR